MCCEITVELTAFFATELKEPCAPGVLTQVELGISSRLHLA